MKLKSVWVRDPAEVLITPLPCWLCALAVLGLREGTGTSLSCGHRKMGWREQGRGSCPFNIESNQPSKIARGVLSWRLKHAPGEEGMAFSNRLKDPIWGFINVYIKELGIKSCDFMLGF